MHDIVLLTRDPETAPNRPNWVLASQAVNPATDTPWRSLVWGKGKFNIKGVSSAEVETSLDDYIANRKGTEYVEQVRLKVYFPIEKAIAYLQKNKNAIDQWLDKAEMFMESAIVNIDKLSASTLLNSLSRMP